MCAVPNKRRSKSFVRLTTKSADDPLVRVAVAVAVSDTLRLSNCKELFLPSTVLLRWSTFTLSVKLAIWNSFVYFVAQLMRSDKIYIRFYRYLNQVLIQDN